MPVSPATLMKMLITSRSSAPQVVEIWDSFHQDFNPSMYTGFSDFCLRRNCTYEESTINTAIAWNIWKRINAMTFNGELKIFLLCLAVVLRILGSGPIDALPPPPPPFLILGVMVMTPLLP
jgi:hypothetical protein